MEAAMRLIMILTGFILSMLGLITFVHSQHEILGVLICFSGIVTICGGLPYAE